MDLIFFVFLALCLSIFIGWVSIPNIVIIAKQKKLFDQPDERKVHSGAIPRLGGVSFFPATYIAFCFSLGLRYYYGQDINILKEGQFLSEFMLLTSGMFILFMIGIADDLVGVSPSAKFVVQFMAATMLVVSRLYINDFEGLVGIHDTGEIFGSIFTVVMIVFAINSFNLIDGVDGLCSGTGVIILSVFGAWFILLGEYVYAMLNFAMLGVVITFFLYNVMGKRLKVFMGDTGSLTLGMLITFSAIKLLSLEETQHSMIEIASPLSVIIGILFVPLFDTARVFTSRILSGKSPFHPDKTHIHHKLLALKLNHLKSTTLLLSLTTFMLFINLVMSQWLDFNINVIVAVDILGGIALNIYLNKIIAKKEK